MTELQLKKAHKMTGWATLLVGLVTIVAFVLTSLSTAPDGYGYLGLIPSFGLAIVFVCLLVKYIQFSRQLKRP
jgi:1,4-dihydroxy-2-naphthoate octaprenyltransferase